MSSVKILEKNRLEKFLAVIADKKIFSIIMTQIDPDAIGAAACMVAILESILGVDVVVNVYYCKSPGNWQNRAIINESGLGERFKPIEMARETGLENVILLDSHSINDSRSPDWLKIDPIVIIDHHQEIPQCPIESESSFYWIEEIGATCTLLVELAVSLEIDFSNNRYKELANILAVGIHNDTYNLIDAKPRDREAHAHVASFVNSGDFRRLTIFDLPDSFNNNMLTALQNRQIKGQRLVTGLGIIPNEEGDDVSLIGDHLIRTNGVNLVVVWAIIDLKFIRISIRCSDLSINLNSLIKQLYGENTGGSKKLPGGSSYGGALIPLNLGVLSTNGEKSRVAITEMVSVAMADLIFQTKILAE